MKKQDYMIFGFMIDKKMITENEDFEIRLEKIKVFKKLHNLAKKHQRLAIMDCNGEGYLKGKLYKNCNRNYYNEQEQTIFYVEMEKLETKIDDIAQRVGWKAVYQGDPRGATVKLLINDKTVYFQDIE